MDNIKKLVKKYEEEVIKIRRDLHKHPEVGFDLARTSKKVANILNELGFEVKTEIGKTGVVGIIEGNNDGPTIALRADMDALPMEEKTDLDFASVEKGKMHACGHDGHTAILLGVAMVLAEIKDKLRGNVKLIFQPAEEGPGGAEPMIEDGVMDAPKVDAILGLHIWLEMDAGKVGVKKGPLFASIDEVDIKIKGDSSHGASPHQGVDAITTAAEVINSLQSIVSRKIDPIDSAVVTIGKIEGGYVRNVIADEVNLEGTIRALNPEVRKQLEDEIRKKVKNICLASDADYEIDYRHMYPPLVNDKDITDLVKENAIKVMKSENVIDVKEPTMGGEDFAYFLKEVPGTFFLLGGRNEEKGITAAHHNTHFTFDEDIMTDGIEIMIKSVLDFLERNE
ncbi:MAG TPA: amidohydrolase [Halanaerobiales bacterium]|nr:amidohydrolase [Halanaerobiales bacterium]